MAEVRVTAAVRDAESVVGGSLFVDVTLESLEAMKLVLVPSPEAESRFEYELSSKDGTFTVARRLYDQERLIHPPPPAEPSTKPLKAGERVTYGEDVAAYYLRQAPPPGDYTMVVHYVPFEGPRASSGAVAVRIVPARPTAMAQAFDLSGVSLVTAFVHEEATG